MAAMRVCAVRAEICRPYRLREELYYLFTR
jgi:hypothetical protein